jgi:flagellar biosynthesis protein
MDRRRKAAALKYKPEDGDAPRVIAKGSGSIADRILEVAKEHKVPLKEDAQLVEVLSAIDLNREIPPELYKAVAEVLAFVYRMTKKDTSAILK